MIDLSTNGSLRLALFALTGFGNTTLLELSRAGFTPEFVVTRAEPGPYPYYREEPLPSLADRLGVPCITDIEGEARLEQEQIDVLIVATYHRIIPRSMLQRIAWPINLHPSLLPRYRGPNPFFWVIRNGEMRTGVTAHLISPVIDAGPILWSEGVEIVAGETQGSLRRRLAAVAGRGAAQTLAALAKGETTLGIQDERAATSFPRVRDADRSLRPELTVAEAERIVRACSPFPGALAEGRLVSGIADAVALAADGERLHYALADGELVLRLA